MEIYLDESGSLGPAGVSRLQKDPYFITYVIG